MTKFEQVGANYQYTANTKEEADRSFRYSCRCCCERGMRIECDRCAIAVAHELVIAAFDSKEGAQHA
jgi:hypothetical protein